ncbi:hypothetical protein [Streptomyces sp. NBC_01264]|uniref:hypothetical protein n=1 Tax=Streptomyces sp. NBC_01264 TaxID=2903804 RepID=UPI002253C7D9|nr:hypothetical protein [Streptomyces sp. NBC_01264]MCX4775470.1 hypothetical protein [Streptomyces sp. NBC_01264]
MGDPVSQRSVYDGRRPHVPRAAALRAVCSCGWAGLEHRLEWEAIGDRDPAEAGDGQADACDRDWSAHTDQVEATTVPLPETVTMLVLVKGAASPDRRAKEDQDELHQPASQDSAPVRGGLAAPASGSRPAAYRALS